MVVHEVKLNFWNGGKWRETKKRGEEAMCFQKRDSGSPKKTNEIAQKETKKSSHKTGVSDDFKGGGGGKGDSGKKKKKEGTEPRFQGQNVDGLMPGVTVKRRRKKRFCEKRLKRKSRVVRNPCSCQQRENKIAIPCAVRNTKAGMFAYRGDPPERKRKRAMGKAALWQLDSNTRQEQTGRKEKKKSKQGDVVERGIGVGIWARTARRLVRQKKTKVIMGGKQRKKWTKPEEKDGADSKKGVSDSAAARKRSVWE